MATSVDPGLLKKLEKFGVKDAATCFNCGNCTAVCSLSTESTPFPRKVIRYLQIGAEEKLLHSPEPWLCYYCGDCSDTCPRDADPGAGGRGDHHVPGRHFAEGVINPLFKFGGVSFHSG